MAFRRRRGYRRRYRRRAVSRVRTVTGRSASFVKLPSYKNLSYKGNERSGILHEIKFVKQIPINFSAGAEQNLNYAFMYINCMQELIQSQDFLKYAEQYQDYCPYAVTISSTCPVSLVGNCLLTNKLYDWPYYNDKPGDPTTVMDANYANSFIGQHLISPSQFYTVGSLPQDADFPVTLETFDTFFASHSTSKKLWNANIPYGVRYSRYYATSAQKAQVANILQDAIVSFDFNDVPDMIAANVSSVTSSVNLIYNSDGTLYPMNRKAQNLVTEQIGANEGATISVGVSPPEVYTFNYSSGNAQRACDVYSYLWSLQRGKKGQFNPFYYVGVNLNQTQLSTTDTAKQVLTLTFKFYVYFKNEITNFFKGVTGKAASSTTSGKTNKNISVVDDSGVQNQVALQVQALLNRSIQNFRANRTLLSYNSRHIASQLVQLTVPEIFRQGLQRTFIGNYLLSYYRDDPTIYGSQRNGFVIDESCYDPSVGKYVFQGYIDLMPQANANYLLQNRYEPDSETTDSKFITNFGANAASTSIADTMKNLNANYSFPQWSQILEFTDYNEVFTAPLPSCFYLATGYYTSNDQYNIARNWGLKTPSQYPTDWYTYKYCDYCKFLTSAICQVINFVQVFSNLSSEDPYFYGQLGSVKLRVINLDACIDNVGNFTPGNTQYNTFWSNLSGYDVPTNTPVEICTFLSSWRSQFSTHLDSTDPNYTDYLASINGMIVTGDQFVDKEDFDESLLICVHTGVGGGLNAGFSGTYTLGDLFGSVTGDSLKHGWLFPVISTLIPGGVFTNAQVVVLEQLIKDFVYQTQSLVHSAVFTGYDPATVDLSTEDLYLAFIQLSNWTSIPQYGWYSDVMSYQTSLQEAVDTFLYFIPETAKKVWKKIKGFLSKAWSAIKKVGKGVIKIAGGTLASAYIPGGAAVASALVPSGISDVVSEVSTLCLSGQKTTYHYVGNRITGVSKTNSTGLVKVLITPGVCPLTSAQPVDLDSPQFVDQSTYEISSVDIGDYSEGRLTTTRISHGLRNLPRYTIVKDGEEIEGSFVQARLKVQVYMDKPSEDFILPTTYIGVGVNNYYEEETA